MLLPIVVLRRIAWVPDKFHLIAKAFELVLKDNAVFLAVNFDKHTGLMLRYRVDTTCNYVHFRALGIDFHKIDLPREGNII